jgi:hypothetical protein
MLPTPSTDLPTTADDEGFALPVHGLFADLDAGLGCINLPDDFSLAPSVNQLRLQPAKAQAASLWQGPARTGRCRGAACRS